MITAMQAHEMMEASTTTSLEFVGYLIASAASQGRNEISLHDEFWGPSPGSESMAYLEAKSLLRRQGFGVSNLYTDGKMYTVVRW